MEICDDSKTPTMEDMKSALKKVTVSTPLLSSQDIERHTGQSSSGNSTSIDDDADTDIEDLDGPRRRQPSTSGSSSKPPSAKESGQPINPKKLSFGKNNRKNEGDFACDTDGCGYRSKWRGNLKQHCEKQSHHASCLSPDKDSEKMEEGREELADSRDKTKDEPEALEECAACGKPCSNEDFVKKLKESAIRNLEHVSNVDKVVAAKKMCRKCFLGKSGVEVVASVTRGKSSSKSAQARLALTKEKVESADQEKVEVVLDPVKGESASAAPEDEMEGDFDLCLESHDKDFEGKERRIKALKEKCDGLGADLEGVRKELSVKDGKLAELNLSLEKKDQLIQELKQKRDGSVESAEKMQTEMRAQAQEEIDIKDKCIAELRQEKKSLEAIVQKMKDDGTDIKNKILNVNELVEKNGCLEADAQKLRIDLSTKDEKIRDLEEELKSSSQSTEELGVKLKVASERALYAQNSAKMLEGRKTALCNEKDMKLKAAKDEIKKLEEIKELKIEALKHAEEAMRRADDNMKKEMKSKADKISELESKCKKLEADKTSINEDKYKELAVKDALISDLKAKGATSSDLSSQCLKVRDDQIAELKSRCQELENEVYVSINTGEAKEKELTEKNNEILGLQTKCSEFKATAEKRSEETEKLRERLKVIEEASKKKLEVKDVQISDLESKCRQLEDEKKVSNVDRGRDLTAKDNEISDLRTKLAEIKAVSEEGLMEKEKLKDTLKEMEEVLATKSGQINEYEKRCVQLEKDAKAVGERGNKAIISKDKEISNLKVKCKELKATSDDKSVECDKLKKEIGEASKQAKERSEAEKQAKAERVRSDKALESLKSDTKEKVRRLEEAIAVKDKNVEAMKKSSEEEKRRDAK